MMKIEKKALFGRLETKFATSDTNTGTMSGYGAVFGNKDSYGDIIAPGAFTDTLAEHKAAGTLPLMLLNHGLWDLPIGVWDDMAEDGYGLKVAGHFIDNSMGQDAYRTAKAGAITGLSIGFIVLESDIQDGNRLITKVRLLEVSLVTLPANDLARVSDVKSIRDTAVDRLEALLLEAKSIMASLETKLDGEDGDECDDDSDCDDDCECQDGECQCDDANESTDEEETKYSEAAMSAISELRSWLGARFQ